MIINGFIPVVRCICGRWNLVPRAVNCSNCKAVLWIKETRKHVRPYVGVAGKYPKHDRRHKRAKIVGWVAA